MAKWFVLGVLVLVFLCWRSHALYQKARPNILRTLLWRGELSGKEIRLQSYGFVGNRGTIYVYLSQLCDEGLVEPFTHAPEGEGQPNQYTWGLTRLGAQVASKLCPGAEVSLG